MAEVTIEKVKRLEDVVAGDEIVVCTRLNDSFKIIKVERVTKTLIIINGCSYRKSNGRFLKEKKLGSSMTYVKAMNKNEIEVMIANKKIREDFEVSLGNSKEIAKKFISDYAWVDGRNANRKRLDNMKKVEGLLNQIEEILKY